MNKTVARDKIAFVNLFFYCNKYKIIRYLRLNDSWKYDVIFDPWAGEFRVEFRDFALDE